MIRLLDVGAHDGFIGIWLARELAAAGHEVRIDGCDLHPRAVETANRRLADAGLAGQFVRCAAEDAPGRFKPGSYDAVLCYELIEHVPDVDRLLAACERMVRRGGEVYVSTPNGTFGEGRNPHHLRTYRAVDLVDVLRRRGELTGAQDGPDGLVVARYRPGRRKRRTCAIYTGPCWAPWSPTDIEGKGLGGSETAAVRVADELSGRGWAVTVYGEVVPGAYRQTVYRHHGAFDPTEPRDVLISSRIPQVFGGYTEARRRVLWVHDVDCGDALEVAHADRIDAILCLSRWHERHLRARYPWLPPQALVRVGNGIEPGYFKRAARGARARTCVYSSSPDRGLDVLLRLWPRVRERVPDAVLAYCYPDVYDAAAAAQPQLAEFRREVAALAGDLGDAVRPLGSLPQQELARTMMGARVWAHPSWTPAGPFHETFCIGAVEAAAAGLVRVGSAWGALAERELDVAVPGPGGTAAWEDGLVDGIAAGLADDGLLRAAGKHGRAYARDHAWRAAARGIERALLPGPVMAAEVAEGDGGQPLAAGGDDAREPVGAVDLPDE